MKTLKALTTMALSATLLCGCVSNAGKDAIMTINNEPITQVQYQKEFNEATKNPMLANMGIDLKNNPESPLHLMLKDRVVNELIIKNLLDQDIKKRKIKVSAEEIDNELRIIIDQIGSKEKFNEVLRQNGIKSTQFKEDIEKEIQIRKLIDDVKKVSISDNEAEKFYKANINSFKHPERVKASHILVAANKDEIRALIMADVSNQNLTSTQIDEKVRADLATKYDKAKKLLNEVKIDPTKFAQVAKENSDDPGSAQRGGDLGYFTREQMVEEFSKAAFSTKPSMISDIVVSPFGYHIIMVTDRQEAGTESFEKAKATIKSFLEQQEKINVLQKHIEKLRNEADIVFVDASYNPTNIQKQIKENAQKQNENSAVNFKKEEVKK